RYVELEIIGTKNNPGQWSNVWEAEIYGANSSSAVDEGEEEVIPAEYGISQNYPNPFNPSTKVQVKMKETGVVKLDVYNILGEKVLAVLDEELSGGIHEIDIDGSRLASGTYIYQLNIDGKFSQVKKMNLIK
ncbi:MAG: T9SS type A sorting domain-containing protein, partial [Ignavibacteriales bacterium]|nr:T9SS type A sorting domain-containing protein [Ignavibacteriales bacterium]